MFILVCYIYVPLKFSHAKIYFFFNFFLNLFMIVMEREEGRDIGRGRGRLPAGSLMQDLIPGPRDHALSRRQMLPPEPPRGPMGVLFGNSFRVKSFHNPTNYFYPSYFLAEAYCSHLKFFKVIKILLCKTIC